MNICGRDPNESNDCSVIAVSHCLGIPYKDAQKKLEYLGRMCGYGVTFEIGSGIEELGLRLREDIPPRAYGRIKHMFNKGRFIVKIKGHVFAVVDGKNLDNCTTNDRQKVRAVYEYDNHRS